MEEYISGVIMFEETLYQKSDDGTPFVDILRKKSVIPGIKVDLVLTLCVSPWVLTYDGRVFNLCEVLTERHTLRVSIILPNDAPSITLREHVSRNGVLCFTLAMESRLNWLSQRMLEGWLAMPQFVKTMGWCQ